MRLTLHTDRASYAPGQPVHLRLEVFNDTREAVHLRFNSSQQYDFEVLWEDQRLWHWSADRMFAQVLTAETLAPGQRREYEATWNGRLVDGVEAKPGEYISRGYLTLSGRVDPLAEQSFTVTG
jgi:intracellular proteinase inhibitor BsuPI